MDSVEENPPNEESIELVQKKNRDLLQDVFGAWNYLYEQQNSKNEWPEIRIGSTTVDFEAPRISSEGCEQYRYRIVEEFKKMLDDLYLITPEDKLALTDSVGIGESSNNATSDLDTEGNVTPKATKDKKEFVLWDDKDREKIISEHFSWARIPTRTQIHVAQEDFWIYKNILDAIKVLNKNATTTNVRLKEIRSIQIAQQAADTFKQRQEKGFFDEKSFVKKGDENATGIIPETVESTESLGEEGDGSTSELSKEFRLLYEERYVDSRGMPLSAVSYNQVSRKSETRNVPIYMSLIIKQDSLSEMMLALVNADKPVDIKLVVINPGNEWKPTFDFSRFEDAEHREGDSGVSTGRVSSRPARGRNTSRKGEGSNLNAVSHQQDAEDVHVEIYGIIRLFNTPTSKRFPELTPDDSISEESTLDEQSSTTEENVE